MNVIRIDHVSLNTADRARTVAWYAEVLGLEAQGRERPADQPVFLGPAGSRLGLFADRAPGLRHIALTTDAGEQAALLRRLERLGIPHQRERHRDSRSVYLADPDGAWLEVMVPVG